MINSNIEHMGRLGNDFFISMASHYIAKKNNLKFNYKNYEAFKKIGIDLYVGEKEYHETIKLTDENFITYIKGKAVYKNIEIMNDMWCQTEEFCKYLEKEFSDRAIRKKIMISNPWVDRYQNNNDLYVHVRLGDIVNTGLTHPIEYYEKTININTFNVGYISSDSIDHDICKYLIKKYNLIPIIKDDMSTLLFASTCEKIILSSGTYSWLIGFLAFYSEIYYPKIINKWHGNIFINKTWKEINI
jgi:hypothetical protein